MADRNTAWLTRSSTSSKVSGRLSRADGSRKPWSTSMSLRLRSPAYWPCSCGHGDVALVDHQQVVVGEVVEQGERRLAVVAAVDVHRVVLDAVAVADLGHHLEVVLRAHAQPLRLEQLVVLLEPLEPLLQFVLDASPWPSSSARRTGDVVGGREHVRPIHHAELLAGERIDGGDAVDRCRRTSRCAAPISS